MASKFHKFLKEEVGKKVPVAEKEILEMWEKSDILRKSVENRPESKPYTFYDGPITANNKPHYGHALTMVIKDVVPRYWTMRGYRVPRSLGWDCQGIPVEYEVEKTLGFEKKEDIEEYGVAKFNQLCRESVEKYSKDIFDLTKRMGRWVNSDEEFATMDPQYIESVWWSLKELYNKGLLYEGYKVVPYSTRAGTPLSNSEVALGGYKDIVDPAVTIKFYLPAKEAYALAWTTTPWTLPGNLLLAVGEQFKYALVESEGERYILAEKLAKDLLPEGYKTLETFTGKELEGLAYEPLFEYYQDRKEQGAFKIVCAAHVSLDDGTGIVHQAPYGEEDFVLMSGMGIEMFDYLDHTGHFTEPVERYHGQFYKAANKKIIEDLKAEGKLYAHADYEHKMPMCWRTDTPLIYKPIRSWYVAVTKISEKLVSENNQIGWVPDHVKSGRFGNWLENARDWALSRNRYWGTPLPVWKCDKTGEVELIGSFEELEAKSGVKLSDPHRPYVDEVTWKNEKTGGTMRRVLDVIDVWYDSGAMPFARLHYPFENKELFAKKFPAAFIAEGIDQTRGWFYTLHVLGVALFGSKAFENVIVNGLALAADGSKMSKSKKNYTQPEIVLDQFGADPLRVYFLSSAIVKGEDVLFADRYLTETNTLFLMPLWNVVKYLLTYADSSGWDPSTDSVKSNDVMDRWMVARYEAMVKAVNENMEAYDLQKSMRAVIELVEELSRWYIRRSRDRFVDGSPEALSTLFTVLSGVARVLAPFAPFTAERIYQALHSELPDRKESVHLEDYPEVNKFDEKLLQEMDKVRQLCSLALKVRDDEKLKLRQPLSTVYLNLEDKELLEVVKGELNVKNALFSPNMPKAAKSEKLVLVESVDDFIALDINVTPELRSEGLLNELIRNLQVLRKESGCELGEKVSIRYMSADSELAELLEANREMLIEKVTLDKVESVDDLSEGEEMKVNEKVLKVQLLRANL